MKLFISQPMKDKSDSEILTERNNIIKYCKEKYDDVEVIESFFQDAPHDAKPLWYLAKSIELLSTADIVYFADGWRTVRGCKIEHICAKDYGLKIIRE